MYTCTYICICVQYHLHPMVVVLSAVTFLNLDICWHPVHRKHTAVISNIYFTNNLYSSIYNNV